MADSYKISLGIDFNDSELKNIKKQLTNLTDNTHRVKIDIDNSRLLKQIEHAKKELKELNSTKGNQPSLTVNTQSLEKSLSRVADVIEEVKRSLGTLDDKSGMKSLISSVNQIATALGKVENESDSLLKSLSALSKKDFSINFDLKIGKSASQISSEQGDIKRGAISQLKQQAKALEDYLDQYYKVSQRQEGVVKLTQGTNLFSTFWEMSPNIGNTKASLKQQVSTLKQYIDLMQEAAKIKGIDLSSVTSGFSQTTSDVIEETKKVSNGAEEIKQAFKGIFGGGLDVEGLSGQLQPIIADLGEIKTSLQSLSSNNSIDGLTASFNRLSETLEKLTANLTLAKNTLDTGFSNTAHANNVVRTAQQTGQKIGEAITKNVKQSINIDDIIDKEVLSLMKTFSIAGDKGSDAFKEIRQALIECRNELQKLKNSDIGIDAEVFDTSRAFDKVSDAIANQMRAVNRLGDEYIKLAKYMANFNDPKKGNKVRVPDFIKQEQGDDYKSSRGTLGIAFNTEKGISFASFIEDLNHELGIAIDLTKGEEKAYEELLHKVRLGREQLKESKKSENSLQATASTDEILSQNYINKNEIRDIAESSIDYINATEAASSALVQSSTQAANAISQAEERKQQAYQETANIVQNISKQTSLVRDNVDFKQVFDGGNQSAKEAQRYFENLLKEEKAVISVKENFDSSVGDSGALKSFTVDIQRATGEVERLHYAMSSADNDNRFLYQGASVSDRNIEKQTEARIKSADKLQTKLEEIRTKYKDMGSAKPIKDSDHINALDKQYRKVEKAIDNVRNADNTMSASAISNAEKQKSILENMVRKYRNAETIATSLRSKDIGTVKATYGSDLDVLIQKMKDAGVYTSGFEKGAENLRTVLADATDPSGLVSFLNGFDKLEAGYKRVAQTAKSLTQTKLYGQKASGIESEIKGWQRINPEINKFEAEIDGAKVSVQSLLSELGQVKTKSDFQIAEGNFMAFRKAAESAGIALTETDADFNRLKSLAKEINSIEFKIAGLDASKNEAEINELTISLNRLHKEYENLFATTSKNLSGSQISQLDDIFEKAGDKLRQLDAQIADTKAKLANGIKVDIELGNFDEQIDAMRVKFNSLSDANDELRRSYNATEDAYTAMINVAKTNTGDEAADRERLIQAEKEYAAALEKTNNLIKQQARADKIANDAEKLADKKTALKLDMSNYLKDNSRAAKEFGDEIRRLSSLLDNVNLDDIGVNKISRTFKNLTKEIKNAGKDGLTVFDRLKSKAKEYMTYLSAAEVFMWIEQGMREMFNTVKEIDTAMTGLYRVTDLTSSQYDALFNNMISSAKEYGATLNDIINATTDWVRAGFEADTALGLAEVTTMYQHISDLDYDTAAENLITAYNGFKNELNGAFDGDQVAAVNYIADVLNELDNNYAATSAGIGEALTRSASALDLAGNSIQETAGMITGIIEVTQDPEQAGKMYARTYSNVWCNCKIA